VIGGGDVPVGMSTRMQSATQTGARSAFFRRVLGVPPLDFSPAIADTPATPWPAGRSEFSMMPPLKLPNAHAEDAGCGVPVDCVGISGPGYKFA
jgi:hypothetical protein